MAEGEGFEPPVPFPVQWFSSSTVGSEPFAKFPTLPLFSAGYKSVDLIHSAWKRFVLIVQPLQFHDSLDGPPRLVESLSRHCFRIVTDSRSEEPILGL